MRTLKSLSMLTLMTNQKKAKMVDILVTEDRESLLLFTSIKPYHTDKSPKHCHLTFVCSACGYCEGFILYTLINPKFQDLSNLGSRPDVRDYTQMMINDGWRCVQLFYVEMICVGASGIIDITDILCPVCVDLRS